jgi:prepilin-type N-terminal cleavage/methylation domain-containing protein
MDPRLRGDDERIASTTFKDVTFSFHGKEMKKQIPPKAEVTQTPAGPCRRSPLSAICICEAPRPAPGFTLLELIVVILLMTILLGFAIPAFQGGALTGSRDNVARELLSAVQKLKTAALRRQSLHKLHLDLDRGRLWVTREDQRADEEAPEQPSEWKLTDATRIAQVRFPGDREIRSGTVAINFYPEGYSDRAIVRLAGDGKQYTDLVIEAFLPMALIASGDGPPAF